MASQTELTASQLPGTAVPASAASAAAPQGKRLLFIDNLRILLICGVLVQHLNDTYGSAGSWMYRDPATTDMFTSTFLTTLNSIGMAAGMGFFFLLAGYFTPGSYDRKGGASFLRDRLIRLGLPWLLYELLIEPLVVYIAHGLPGSYRSFYAIYLHRLVLDPTFLNGSEWIARCLSLGSMASCMHYCNISYQFLP